MPSRPPGARLAKGRTIAAGVRRATRVDPAGRSWWTSNRLAHSWRVSTRIETAPTARRTEIRDEGALERRQIGEHEDAGSELQTASISTALGVDLRAEPDAFTRAESRLALAIFGTSIERARPIPDERLAAEPLAQRTVEEQRHEDMP